MRAFVTTAHFNQAFRNGAAVNSQSCVRWVAVFMDVAASAICRKPVSRD